MKLSTQAERVRYTDFLQSQALPLEVSCKPWKESRSAQQNSLLFGVVYPPIAEAMGYEVADVHEYMLGRHFGWVDKKVPKTPRNPEGIESRPFRTTTRNEAGKRDVLKKAEFTRFLETVERIAAQAGVFIPMDAAA
ncbi:MAG: hypothetical protein JST65_16210 [Acidobacteria bacterium]|nr:hypothetical protein [Acidobacteriota bacterium]